MLRRLKGIALSGAIGALLALGLPSQGVAAVHCKSISNPYAGTRYKGVDLRKIRAAHVKCREARRVVKGAHKKGLSITPPASGIRYYGWQGWQVRGDIRGDHDHYSARRDGATITWVF